MGILDEMLEGKKSIVILGHVNPDGDCIGSCLGLYNYLKEIMRDLRFRSYLEKMGVNFPIFPVIMRYTQNMSEQKHSDLCIARWPAMFRASCVRTLPGDGKGHSSVSTIISQTKVSAGSM